MKRSIIIFTTLLSLSPVMAEGPSFDSSLRPLRAKFRETLKAIKKTKESTLSPEALEYVQKLDREMQKDYIALENAPVESQMKKLKRQHGVELVRSNGCSNCFDMQLPSSDIPFYLQPSSKIQNISKSVNILLGLYNDLLKRGQRLEGEHFLISQKLQSDLLPKIDLTKSFLRDVQNLKKSDELRSSYSESYGLKVLFNHNTSKYSWDLTLLAKKSGFVTFSSMDKKTKKKYADVLQELFFELQGVDQNHFSVFTNDELILLAETINLLQE